MKKIVLFTGAGMCVPMDLPAATGFIETINKCNPSLLTLLRGYLSNDQNDIEKILYALEECINESKFLRYILNANNSNGHFQIVNQALSLHNSHAIAFQQTVKHDLYKILQNFDRSKALTIYFQLIKSLQEKFTTISLSIFTTNYDLIFEDIIDEYSDEFLKLGYKDFCLGFTMQKKKMLFDPLEDFDWSMEKIEYSKLHGSLDWSKDNSGRVLRTGAVTQPAIPDDMPLLYPGYKGTPTEEPFISIHNKLYNRLVESDRVIVIGFAFRDPHINSIFESAIRANSKIQIDCYNPLKIDELPVESGVRGFKKNYAKSFNYIQKKMIVSDDPLGLLDIIKS